MGEGTKVADVSEVVEAEATKQVVGAEGVTAGPTEQLANQNQEGQPGQQTKSSKISVALASAVIPS